MIGANDVAEPRGRLLWPSVAALLAASVYLVFSIRSHVYETRLLDNGIPAVALVTAKRVTNIEDAVFFNVYYEFNTVGGRSVSGQSKVDWDIYEELFEGASIDITYDSSNPVQNRPKIESDALGNGFLGALTVGIVAFGFTWWYYDYKHPRLPQGATE